MHNYASCSTVDAVTCILAGVDGDDRNTQTMIIIVAAIIFAVIIVVIVIVIVIVCKYSRQ